MITKVINFLKSGKFLFQHDGGLKKKTLRSAIWVAISSIGLNSLSIVRSIILARLLTPEIFGLMRL